MAKAQENSVGIASVTKDIKERVVVKVYIKPFLKYCGFEGYRLLFANENSIDSMFEEYFEITLVREYIENTKPES